MIKRKLFRTILAICLITISTTVVYGCSKKSDKTSGSTASEGSASTASEEVNVVIPPMSSYGVMYGVIIEATEKEMTLQSDLGTTVIFKMNKEVDIADVKEGLKPGTAIKVEYGGSFSGESAKNVKVNKVSDSDKLPKLDKGALAAAGSIILAIKKQDQNTLARLCDYPLVFDTGKERRIGSVQEFISLKKKDIFTKRLVNSVERTNLFVTNAYSDGFLLGLSEPNIVVSNTKNGFLISGFHYK